MSTDDTVERECSYGPPMEPAAILAGLAFYGLWDGAGPSPLESIGAAWAVLGAAVMRTRGQHWGIRFIHGGDDAIDVYYDKAYRGSLDVTGPPCIAFCEAAVIAVADLADYFKFDLGDPGTPDPKTWNYYEMSGR